MEQAATLIRVSSDKQDESNQVAEVGAHVKAHGYSVARTFELHDVSASKGEHESTLTEIMSDIQAGKYNVVVIAHSSRIDRRDPRTQRLYTDSISLAGGRIESAREPEFGKNTMGGDIMTVVSQWSNFKYTKDLSDHVKAAQASRRDANALIGHPAFGYGTTQHPTIPQYRTLVPNATGLKYVPEIFQRVANGQTLLAVCQWLDSESVKPNSRKGEAWSPKSVGQIIRNTVYVGTMKSTSGQVVMTDIPALVDDELFNAANKRLDNAPRGRRLPAKDHGVALLTSYLTCANCQAPMYRIFAGKEANRTAYYRCAGHHPQRKGCGQMIKVDELDSIAEFNMSINDEPICEYTKVPGHNWNKEIARLGREISNHAMRASELSTDDFMAEMNRLSAELADYKARPATDDTYESVPTGETFASKWNAADATGKRAMLKDTKTRFTYMRDSDGAKHVRILTATPESVTS